MKKPIELSDISRYRGELMGLAMLFVMLFHVWMPKSNPMYGFVRCGNVGVDIFLLLSGVGLWFSWTKNPSLKHFFLRRYLRVYPVWIIILHPQVHQYSGWRLQPRRAQPYSEHPCGLEFLAR